MSTLKVPVSGTDHYQGPLDAPLVLVEYGDYQCPYCGAAYPVVKALKEKYGDQLVVVFRNFPLAQMHEHALSAALVAEYAAHQGEFWPVHDALYEHQNHLGPLLYAKLAEQFGWSLDDLEQSLANLKDEPKVKADFEGGVLSGVNGTPTFFMNGQRYNNAADVESMSEAIDQLLARS